MNYQQQLIQECAALSLEAYADPLLSYVTLLHKWNQAYNLTAVRRIEDMIPRHLLDSLAIRPWIHGTRLLDVGSGAGLPGIPLAITCPHLHVTVMDSNGKKTRFLNEVKRLLCLTNLTVVQSRVEDYEVTDGFHTIVSRAFTQLDNMVALTQHLLGEDGRWVAMKSLELSQELLTLSHPYHIEKYMIPGCLGERCCVIIRPLV